MAVMRVRGLHLLANQPLLSCIYLLLFLLSRGSASTKVESLSGKPYDTNYDWESTVIARGPGGCEFAPKAMNRPPPTCPPPSTAIDRATASELGWKFAPILYQHPLDNSWLTDPQRWLNEATAYDMVFWERLKNTSLSVPKGVQANHADDEYLSAQQWFATRLTVPTFNFTDRTVSFDTVNGTTLMEKAIMDPVVDGRLTGKVWYTVFRPYDQETGETIPYAYVYTFMYWYPWNGCSNQALGTQVDGKKQGVEYYMCGDGAHEGDLEHIKVWVCEADMLGADPSAAIQRTQYSQHGWLPELDCKAGECEFETDKEGTRRLVALAGLFSHANWKRETPLYVYAKVRLNMLLNMDGLYVADRFMKGPVFYPDSNNTAFLPFRSEMTAEQASGTLAWTLFPGIWGATITWTGKRTITCFKNNFTELAPCDPANPAYYILEVFTDPAGWKDSELNWTAVSSGNTVTGPLWRRTFAYSWEAEREAPMYTNPKLASDRYCPLEAPLQVTTPHYSGFERISLVQYLAVVTGLVIVSAVVAVAMILPALLIRGDREVIKQIEEEEEAKLEKMPAELKGNPVSEEPPFVRAPSIPQLRDAPDDMGLNGNGGQPPAAAASEASEAKSGTAAGAAAAPLPSLTGVNGNAARSRLSLLLLSHEAILRAFHASVMQPWFLVAWMFIGIALYVAGVVLGVLGVYDSVQALNRIYRLALWQVLHTAVIAAFIVFGVIHLAITVTSIWVRPFKTQLCACGPKAVQCHMKCLNSSWAAHAVLVGLLVMEMNVSMLLFAFGLMLWIARYMMTEACVFAVSKIFNGIIFLDDICVDLSFIGLPDNICGTGLTSLCNIWGGLKVDFLSFGAMCFIIAQAMFLALATTNYVATRTGYAITTVMHLTAKTEVERVKRTRARSGGSGGSGGRNVLFALSSGLRNRSKADSAQVGDNGNVQDPANKSVKGGANAKTVANADAAAKDGSGAAPGGGAADRV